ncbi:hypothetical protein ABIC16_004151 [Sphingomonas sp. PvP055]
MQPKRPQFIKLERIVRAKTEDCLTVQDRISLGCLN